MDILEIHRSHNYIVSLVNIDDTTLIVDFPQNIFADIPHTSVIFSLTDDGFCVENTEVHENDVHWLPKDKAPNLAPIHYIDVDCKDYEIRPLIQQTIAINCQVRGISLLLIDSINSIFQLRAPQSLDDENKFVEELANELENADSDIILAKGILL